MKDDKDKLLKNKLEQAWDVPPMSPGFREHFLGKLERSGQSRHRRPVIYIGISAAVAAVIVAFLLLVGHPTADEAPLPVPEKSLIAEVEACYKAKLWSESECIALLTGDLDEQTRQSLLQEVKKLEFGPDSLVRLLRDEPLSDERKISYISQVYESHLRSLRQIHGLLSKMGAEKQARQSTTK